MTAATLEHTFTARGAARQLLESRAGEVLVASAAGTGKTRAALTKVMLVALKYPGSRHLLLRKTAVSLTSTTLVTWREHVAAELLAAGSVEYYGGSQEEPAQYRFDNGSAVMVGGMDRPLKVMSSEYDTIYAGEAIEFTLTDWELASSRLRNGRMPYQQLLADTNPTTPLHWLYQRTLNGPTTLLTSKHEDNPRLYDELPDGTYRLTEYGTQYMARLDALTGVRYLRLRKGLWVAAEGLIYEHWNPDLHMVDRLPAGAETWPRFWSVDFGFVHPFVLQMWAESPDGALYLYRELYRSRRLVEDHARDALACVTDDAGRWTEPKPVAIICDHDAEDRATLERHLGMGTVAAKKTVSDGIQAVAARLGKPEQDGAQAVAPRLFIVRNATVHRDQHQIDAVKPAATEEEMPGYRWADGAKKEQPHKEDDDGADALRYVCAHRDLQPKVNWERFLS